MKEFIRGIFLGIATILAVGAVFSLPVMWLWNWLLPEIFGLIEINVWQALGISALSGFLFKGK